MTFIAMLGIVGVVYAAGPKPLPSKKPMAPHRIALNDDGSPNNPSPAGTVIHNPNPNLAAPSNDDCSGAIVIPAGSYPVVTAAVDITDATPQGVGDGSLSSTCNADGQDYTIWYSFTPTVSAAYTFSTFAQCGATGNTVQDTVIAIVESADLLGACPDGAEVGCNDSAPSACTQPTGADQSFATATLTAGVTYFVVLGHWVPDAQIAPGLSDLAVIVDISPAPDNDTCAGAEPLTLSQVTTGTTVAANNDYLSNNPSTAACFSGLGQVATVSGGRDVVYTFEAPAAGLYSFRTFNDTTAADLFATTNATIYVASDCASSSPTCIKGANRKNPAGRAAANLQNRAEEVNCISMTAGQLVYVFVDTRVGAPTPADGGFDGGFPFSIEVFPCTNESEPNDTPATADAMGCWNEGAINPLGDADFWAVGTPAAGSLLFAVVDARQAFSNDFDMRVTTTTDTLEFDADDGAGSIGSNSTLIAGVPATGASLFYRISHKNAAQVCSLLTTKACTTNADCINNSTTAQGICNPRVSEPYHLLSVVQPDIDSASFEAEPNDGFGTANSLQNGYVYGATDDGFDQPDAFRFCVYKGDDMTIAVDADPFRDNSSSFPQPNLYDVNGFTGYFTGGAASLVSNNVPSPGTLTGTTPSNPAEGFEYRARYTGPYWFIVFDNGLLGDYLASIAINCQPFPARAPSEVSMTKTGPTGPQATNSILTYEVTVTNSGTDLAQDIVLTDTLSPSLELVDIFVSSDFSDTPVGDVSCSSLPNRCSGDLSKPCGSGLPPSVPPAPDCDPANGEGVCLGPDASIVCNNYCLAPGSTTTYTVVVRLKGCVGTGTAYSNTASITTLSEDPDPSNNGPVTLSGTAIDDGTTCSDQSVCTSGDHCEGNTCVTTLNSVDDNDGCTDDFCDPVAGEFHQPTASSLQCDDGFACTANACDPATGLCTFPPGPDGVPCNDFFFCTGPNGTDACLAGVCTGAPTCDDGNACSDDLCDENSQSCSYSPSPAGAACSDGNPCTTGDACNGANGCVPGTGALNCDDNNACTADSCDPSVAGGCVHTAIVCNDNSQCTTDTCNPASGCVYTPISCDDGNCCTNDACNPTSGCFHTANTTPPTFTTQPSLGACAIIWPPQHGYVDFTVANTGAVASSACGIASVAFNSCSSSQPENGNGVGDGNSIRDCVYEPGVVHFRSERDGACSPHGRLYTTSLIATDVCGNSTVSNSFSVGVWHDRGHSPVGMPLYAPVPGSNTNDTRPGTNGTYGTGCGPGTCGEAGQAADNSDFAPEAEIQQQAAITVDNLKLEKASGGNVKLTWTDPSGAGINVTRFHVYHQDPVTGAWTLLAEVSKQTLSYLTPVLNDSIRHQYKVSAVIK